MSANRKPLRKLIESARKARALAPTDSETPAPHGFSTRVAARWVAAREQPGLAGHWERLCWWGASASVAVCVFAFANQSMLTESNPFDVLIEAPADGLEFM